MDPPPRPPGRRRQENQQQEEPEQLGEADYEQDQNGEIYAQEAAAPARILANAPPAQLEARGEQPAYAHQDQADHVAEEDDRLMPDHILPPQDPRRMRLTREERQWGRAVKEAIEAASDLDNLSDFMYAQIALVEEGNVEKALERAHMLQGFRQEYDVLDTCADALWRLERFIRRVPGHVMHHFFSEDRGGYVAVVDAARMDPTCFRTTEGTKDFLAGTYYVHHTLCVDMDAIRQGATIFGDFGGCQWIVANGSLLDIWRLVCSDSIASYPFEIQQVQCFNTGTMMNTLISFTRQWLPQPIRTKVSVGHTGSLRDVCLVPSVEEAIQRVTHQMKEALRERYTNIRNFNL